MTFPLEYALYCELGHLFVSLSLVLGVYFLTLIISNSLNKLSGREDSMLLSVSLLCFSLALLSHLYLDYFTSTV